MAAEVKDSLVVNQLITGLYVASAYSVGDGYIEMTDKYGSTVKALVYK